MLYLHRYTWNIISPKLQESPYSLSHTQTEFLFSLFYYTYAALQIPSGVVIDRWGPRWFLTFSILFWSVALALLAAVFLRVMPGSGGEVNLSLIIIPAAIARLLFGAAQAGCYPALTKASKVWFAPQGRTALQGLIASTAGRSGAAMSSIIFATLMMGWLGMTWQASLICFAATGLLFAAIFWWGYSDSPDTDPRPNEVERLLIQGGEIPATAVVNASTLR